MKVFYFTFILITISMTTLSAQLVEAEGNVKIDNTLELFDRSSGAPHKVASIIANFPVGANNTNSPSLTLKTETSPIPSNGFADIKLESSDEIFLNTNTATRLYVGPSGRVGIGTESPDKLLHVTDDVVIGGGTAGYGSASEYVRLAAQNADWYMAALNEASQAASDFAIGLSSGSSDYFHIQHNGDIGIGTSSPTTRLSIEDSGANPMRITSTSADNYSTFFTTNGYIGYQGVYNGDADMDFGTGFLNNIGKVHLVTKTIPRLTIDPDGNAGIGTTSPQSKLHVSGGTGSVELMIEADTNNSGESNHPKVTLSQDGGQVTGELGYYNATNDLRIRNNFGGAAILLKANGDIIIGTN